MFTNYFNLFNEKMLRQYWIIRVFLPMVFFFLISSLMYGAIMNQVVAVVNGDIITAKDLDQLLRPLYSKYQRAYTGANLTKKIEKARFEALNQLIERKLIAQEAIRLDILAEEKEVDGRLRHLKAQFDNEEMFYYTLQKEGMSIEEVRENLKEQIMVQKLTRRELAKEISVSPLEITRYYNKTIDQYQMAEMVSAKHILIKKSVDKEKVQEKLTLVKKKLEENTDFSDLAREFSEGPKADDGGDLGFFARGKMLSELDKKAFELKVGEISDVIETDLGYHFLQINARKKERTQPLSEVYKEVQNIIYQEKVHAVREKWISSLRKKAHIKVYI